jgi:hypothetical protein
MDAFLSAALSFPTVVFTVLLALFAIYALLTVIGAIDLDLPDADLPDSPIEGVLNFLGIGDVPVAIFGAFATIFAWLASFAAMQFLPQTTLVKIAVGIGAALLGLRLGSWSVWPLRRVFATVGAPGRQAIVGKICTIRSLQVSEQSGSAEVADGGAGFIAEVRCFRENELTRGSKAIVYDYDSKEGIYHVGPIDPSIAE